MKTLAEVKEAKELMKEAMEWSSFKWLWEKQRVRRTADVANAALDRLERSTKAKWSENCRAIYKKLSGKKVTESETTVAGGHEDDTQLTLLVEKMLEADHAWKRAKQAAEDAFDEAERRMSTDLAREGCKRAIHSWELHEKAIRQAALVVESSTEKPTLQRLDGGNTQP